MRKDYYLILGIQPGASAEEVDAAYQKLAIHGEMISQRQLAEVEEAYAILSNPLSRQQYDRGYRRRGKIFQFDGLDVNQLEKIHLSKKHSPRRVDNDNLMLELNELLGGLVTELRGRVAEAENIESEAALPEDDIFVDLDISASLAKGGGAKQLDYERLGECAECAGLGSWGGAALVTCRPCRGKGKQRGEPCGVCSGLGKHPEINCQRCLGEGRVKTRRQVEVVIPKQTNGDTTLRVARGGHRLFRDNQYGDLYVKVKVK